MVAVEDKMATRYCCGVTENRLSTLPPEDETQVAALLKGDEQAFAALVDRYHGPMVRIALLFCPNEATAEEIVQETWIGILRGLSRFEGRSSLRTWMFRILTNQAKTRGQRENRSVPFSQMIDEELARDEPSVDPIRFRGPDDQYHDGWMRPLKIWTRSPEERLVADEQFNCLTDAMNRLPVGQQEVFRLRDVEGWSSDEVCEILDISEGNQRVLLHRARSRIRRALEVYNELAAR
jgi:RNA polymerase sigma-70 factor (ECF subfamily)